MSREQEFERLYLESFPLVYNYVRFRMANVQDTEDIVAEAFLLAARSFDKFDPTRAKFSTWVVKIAINCMRGHWRHERPTVNLDDVPEATLAVWDERRHAEDQELVDRLLKELTSQERELVAMKYQEGMRNVDIAHALNMNASTVSTKLSNAIAKMRAAAGGIDRR